MTDNVTSTGTPDGPVVVIADSHAIVREGISAWLTQHFNATTYANASDGYTLLKLCRQHNPDIVMMDYSITRPSSSEVLVKLRETMPQIKVIVLSSDSDTANAFFILSQGAVSFMPKQARGEDFGNAVRAAMTGYAFIPIEILNEFVKSRRHLTRSGNAFGLSPREIEILEATISGMNTKDVARTLNISTRTVETHRNSIYRKTSCKDRHELVAMMNAG